MSKQKSRCKCHMISFGWWDWLLLLWVDLVDCNQRNRLRNICCRLIIGIKSYEDAAAYLWSMCCRLSLVYGLNCLMFIVFKITDTPVVTLLLKIICVLLSTVWILYECVSWSLTREPHLKTLLWCGVLNVTAACRYRGLTTEKKQRIFCFYTDLVQTAELQSEEVHGKKLSKWNFNSFQSLRLPPHHKAAALC